MALPGARAPSRLVARRRPTAAHDSPPRPKPRPAADADAAAPGDRSGRGRRPSARPEVDRLAGALQALLGPELDPARHPGPLEAALAARRRTARWRWPPARRPPPGRRDHARGLADPPDRASTRPSPTPIRGATRGRPLAVAPMIAVSCLQCGTPAVRVDATFCRRCGLPYGDAPRADAELPQCPICYLVVDDDGRTGSLDAARPARRPAPPHGRARPPPGRRRRVARDPARGRQAALGPLERAVRDRPPLPRDRAARRRAQPAAGPRPHRHGDDPAPPLGPGADILGDQPEWQAARGPR